MKLKYYCFFLLFVLNILFFVTDKAIAVEGGEKGIDTATTLNNPLTGKAEPTDINVLIGTVINGVMGVVGSLALLMFVYGGLLWMTSSGNSEQVEKGKKTLIYATLGLIVIFASYALVALVLNVISGTG